ncbi:MAG: C1 family peptidase, partial [Blastocatellia bacterium]
QKENPVKNHRLFAFSMAAILMTLAAQTSSSVTPQRNRQAPAKQPTDQDQASPEAREKLRRLAAQKKTYKVGYSPVMDRKEAQLTGIEIPKDEPRRALLKRAENQRKWNEYLNGLKEKEKSGFRYQRWAGPEQDIREQVRKEHPGATLPEKLGDLAPLLSSFDWRRHGVYLNVLDQGDCGSCWAFATTAAFWSNSILNYRRSNPEVKKVGADGQVLFDIADAPMPPPMMSAQPLLNCIAKSKGDCSGGWHGSAFNHFVEFGAILSDREYAAKVKPCEDRSGRKAVTWDYVNYPPDKLPSVKQLKEALLEHGPLAVLIRIDEPLKAYKGGVFNEHNPGAVNHAVLMLGWDNSKKAWLIMNSWGRQWGEDGFMWIAWGSNNVGMYAAWIEVPST